MKERNVLISPISLIFILELLLFLPLSKNTVLLVEVRLCCTCSITQWYEYGRRYWCWCMMRMILLLQLLSLLSADDNDDTDDVQRWWQWLPWLCKVSTKRTRIDRGSGHPELGQCLPGPPKYGPYYIQHDWKGPNRTKTVRHDQNGRTGSPVTVSVAGVTVRAAS